MLSPSELVKLAIMYQKYQRQKTPGTCYRSGAHGWTTAYFI